MSYVSAIVVLEEAKVTITNSTIAYNSGGGVQSSGAASIHQSTIVGNDGIGVELREGTLSLGNSIVFDNGLDCARINGGTVISNINNLIETTGDDEESCGPALITDDPNLAPLADYGGPTQTMALLPGSPAIDAGDDDTCEETDQRGVTRPQGDHCDIGAFEYEPDTIPPSITSITRADANPTAAASVRFTVIFSEPVNVVDEGDFELTTSGVSGATITEVNGADDEYTVTVNTGSGSGTLRLDVHASAEITDLAGNPLEGLPYTDGEVYDIQKRRVFKSNAKQDGWILESTETSNKGGTLNRGASTLNLGDDSANRQYRAILSFTTSAIPANADITKVTLRLKWQGVTGGGNPVNIFKGFMVDIKTGNFGKAGLQLTDFNAKADQTLGAFKPKPASGWYTINLTKAKGRINPNGNTQIRLRFKLDDNNNGVANFLALHSGNAKAANRPQLIVEYSVP
jgi:hypothetical protein